MLGFILMIGGIIAIVIGFLCLHASKDAKVSIKDKVSLAVIGIGATAFVCSFVLLVCERPYTTELYQKANLVNSTTLYAMTSDTGTKGSVAGGRSYVYGYLSTENTYVFLYQREDGGYKKISVNADDVVIYELDGDDRQPQLEYWQITTYKKNVTDLTKVRFFKAKWFWPSENSDGEGYVTRVEHEYRAYIPAGSIAGTFDIGM